MSEFEPPPSRFASQFNWRMFWLVLLSPALLAAIGGALTPNLGFLSPLLGLPAGVFCGVVLGRHVGATLASVILCALFMVLSTGLAFAGCTIGVSYHGI